MTTYAPYGNGAPPLSAGQKAAATRRARRAAGLPPKTSSRRRGSRRVRTGSAFPPKPDTMALSFVALAALETAMHAALADLPKVNGNPATSPEQVATYAKYLKVKALALGATTPGEGRAALRRALLQVTSLIESML